jgi:hypothetical protein
LRDNGDGWARVEGSTLNVEGLKPSDPIGVVGQNHGVADPEAADTVTFDAVKTICQRGMQPQEIPIQPEKRTHLAHSDGKETDV